MIYSMTGFASANRHINNSVLTVEIRTVNSRYLDLVFRMPDELRSIEPALRELLSEKLSRGKVDCRLGFSAATSGLSDNLCEETLTRLATLEEKVRARLPLAAPLSVAEILKWPGLFGDESIDPATAHPAILETCRQVIADVVATRAREGEKLAAAIHERLVRIRAIVNEVTPLVPTAQAAHGEKLKQRLLDALGSADDDRIRQEIVIFAQRADITEELSRLSAHVSEVERVLNQRDSSGVGKRLDFLMQELNREANTLGSKAVVKEISSAAMELKLLIEQMREQIQNLE